MFGVVQAKLGPKKPCNRPRPRPNSLRTMFQPRKPNLRQCRDSFGKVESRRWARVSLAVAEPSSKMISPFAKTILLLALHVEMKL